MEHIAFINLFGVALIAFLVPFVLGFFPRLRVPASAVELVAGIIVGPDVLGWIEAGPVVTIASRLGVAFLLFLAGMELDMRELKGTPARLGAIGWLLSIGIALVLMAPLGMTGFILSPLLCATALSATAVGIVIPVLRDAGQLRTPTGLFTVANGSVAEFGTIALLGVFFSGPESSAFAEALLLAGAGILAVILFFVLGRFSRWEPGRVISNRLEETSSPVRLRFAVVVLLGAAVVASSFGFEVILGTFLAGLVFGMVMRGDASEHVFRTKVEAVGFGFFVPAFFIASGLRFDLDGLRTAESLARIPIFLVALLLIRALPALVYRKHLTTREMLATGLLQATNLSFIVVATSVGAGLKMMKPETGSALIAAGLVSAVLFPTLAQMLLVRRAEPGPVAVTVRRSEPTGET